MAARSASQGVAVDNDDMVEVWVTSGKRYCGRIVDAHGLGACAAGSGSLILWEGGRFYVWIHRAHIRRVRAVNPRLAQLVTPDAFQVACAAGGEVMYTHA